MIVVSFQYWNTLCGNKSGTLEEVNVYVSQHRDEWQSYTVMRLDETGVATPI